MLGHNWMCTTTSQVLEGHQISSNGSVVGARLRTCRGIAADGQEAAGLQLAL